MKQHDISQVPVIDEDGKLTGLVTEISILKHMLEGKHDHSGETISSMVQEATAVFPAYTLLEEVLTSIVEGNVILVTEQDRPIGILTKIDVLDYISQEI